MNIALAPFKSLIKERCGLLFEGNGEEKLGSALAQRQEATGIAHETAYLVRLQSDEAEFQALVNLLTINETYFFREAEQIRLLTDRLAPRLLSLRGNRGPLRILSAGCSSGEEPYSLVMALWEKYGESVPRLFSFFGGDIDSTVLAKAQAGRYTEFSFRGVAAEIRQRYFDRDNWTYQLREQIRSQVAFHELNLLANAQAAALQDFDIIFFRNVSIYFDKPTRKTILENLNGMLREDGVLVIGTAETLANDLGVLPLVEEDGLFYFVKGQALAPAIVHPYPPRPAPALAWSLPTLEAITETPRRQELPPCLPVAAEPIQLPLSTPLPALATLQELTRDKRHDEALAQIETLLAAQPAHPSALLLKAHILLNRKDFTQADALARQVLAVDAWNTDAFLLLGLAAKWQEQPVEALDWFKQAAYARHQCWPAHYYLAELYRQQGEATQARRSYRVVLQLTAEGVTPDTGIKVLPLGLPPGEVRFLCEHQLKKLALADNAEPR